METININDLTAEQRKAMLADLAAVEKAEKQKRKENLDTFKVLSNEFVVKHIDPLVNHHTLTEGLIKLVFTDYKQLQELKASVYGTKINNQDSHTSTLPDGSASITIGWNVNIGFDGTESAGVVKIKEFIGSLATDDENNRKLIKTVNTFLKPNVKTGMLNPAKIIELSKLADDYNDERFNEGLEIIFNAQQRRQNSMYVSGWKFIEVDGIPRKLEFRFTI